MTVREIAKQLVEMSGGVLNGQQFTKDELGEYIERMFGGRLAIENRLVMEITLPDGNWLFTINKYGDGWDCYDYTIPETREEEDRIWTKLMGVE